MNFVFWIIFAVLFLLERTVFNFPFVFDMILVLYVIAKKPWVFAAGFFAGLVLDIIYVRPFGAFELFFLTALFLVFLYERKYEIQTREFVFFFLLLGGLVYYKLFGSGFLIFMSFINAVIGVLIFNLLGFHQNLLGGGYRKSSSHSFSQPANS